MADLFRFIITNFWPFVATCILLSVAGSAVAEIVSAIRGKQE